MPKRTTPFQRLIKNIYSQLAENEVEVVESGFIQEKYADSNREVDILIKKVVAGKEVKIAVECRERTRKDSIDWIDAIIGKYINLEVDEIIAVSKSGFSEPAKQKAKHHKIKTLMLDEAEEIDWNEKIWGLFARTVERNDYPRDIKFSTEHPLDFQIGLETSIHSLGRVAGNVEQVGRDCYLFNLENINDWVRSQALSIGTDFHKRSNSVKISCKPQTEIYFLNEENKNKVLEIFVEVKIVFSDIENVELDNHSFEGNNIRKGNVRDSNGELHQILITEKDGDIRFGTYYIEDVVKKASEKLKDKK